MKYPLSLGVLLLLTACGSGVPGPAPGGGGQEPSNDTQQPGADDQHPSGDDQTPPGDDQTLGHCAICKDLMACDLDQTQCEAWCAQVGSLGALCEAQLNSWLKCVLEHLGPDACSLLKSSVSGHDNPAPLSDEKVCESELKLAKPCLTELSDAGTDDDNEKDGGKDDGGYHK